MTRSLFGARFLILRRHLGLITVVGLLGYAVPSAIAQQRVSKRYPTGKTVRLQLKNVQGTITVESWERDEIKLSATLESPSAHITPRLLADGLSIDVMGDN